MSLNSETAINEIRSINVTVFSLCSYVVIAGSQEDYIHHTMLRTCLPYDLGPHGNI